MVSSGQSTYPETKMPSPTATPAFPVNSPPSVATYTTIPISLSDVVQRSRQNLHAFFNRCRPWPEFLSTANAFDLPASTSDAWIRLRRNSNYFAVNYSVLISCCAAGSLLGTPILLAVVTLLFALWLVLYFFREDPIVVFGRHIGDLVITALVIGSALVIWITGVLNTLLIGVGVGISLSAVHGIFRNPEGLFLDEDAAVRDGLISNSHGGRIS